MGQYSFKKGERLKHKKSIATLFNKSNMLAAYPFNVLYRCAPSDSTEHKVLFAVPQRNIKKASDRNKVKRRSREAYRIEKKELNNSPRFWIGFIYSPKKIMSYDSIRKAVRYSMRKLNGVGDHLVHVGE